LLELGAERTNDVRMRGGDIGLFLPIRFKL